MEITLVNRLKIIFKLKQLTEISLLELLQTFNKIIQLSSNLIK